MRNLSTADFTTHGDGDLDTSIMPLSGKEVKVPKAVTQAVLQASRQTVPSITGETQALCPKDLHPLGRKNMQDAMRELWAQDLFFTRRLLHTRMNGGCISGEVASIEDSCWKCKTPCMKLLVFHGCGIPPALTIQCMDSPVSTYRKVGSILLEETSSAILRDGPGGPENEETVPSRTIH